MKKERLFREILIFAGIALVALLASRFHFRFDLSDNASYTLSPYSRSIISGLDSGMSVTWYRSSTLQQYTPAVRYIADFLEEYRLASDGAFSYRTLDPEAANNTETVAALGIPSRQIEVEERGIPTVRELWSGLLVEYRGEHRVIPFLLDTSTLEYDLTRLVLELRDATETGRNTSALQIIYGTGNPDAGTADYRYVGPWLSYAGFSGEVLDIPVRSLDPAKGLLVIGSSGIEAVTASAVDTFLAAGGNAAFFLSGNTVNIAGDWKAVPKTGDLLLDVLEKRGMTIGRPLVMDISNFRITMPALDNSRNEYINYPFWITALRSGMKSGHPLMAGVRELQFFWPSEISTRAESGAERLVETSPAAVLMDEPYDTDPFGAQLSLFGTGSAGSARQLVAAVNEPGRIVLVADEYLPGTMIEYTGSDANLDFLVNCAEWISGKDRLLELKNRKPESGTEAGASSGTEAGAISGAISGYFGTAFVLELVVFPALIISGAAAAAWRRKRKR